MKKITIIGSGIVGATCAYLLSNKNIELTVVDAHMDGRATSASAGIICPWVSKRRNQDWYVLARNGAAYYHELISLLNEAGFQETGYKQVGAIRLHKNLDNIKELQAIAMSKRELAPEIGRVAILDGDEVKKQFPYIEDSFYGLWIEGAARVDGRLLRDVMLQAAQKNGAQLIKGHATLQSDGTSVDGVCINNQTLKSDQVIATNGVWMNELLSPLDIHLKIQAQKGEVIHLEVDDVPTDKLPVIMPPNNQYMLSFDEGKIVIGASHQHVKNFDTKVTLEGTQYILNEAVHIAPGLKRSAMIETRVGFRPFTFNHLPMFGPVPNFNNVLIANGLGASGLTTGPYIGKQLAALALGEETDIPITPYDVGNYL